MNNNEPQKSLILRARRYLDRLYITMLSFVWLFCIFCIPNRFHFFENESVRPGLLEKFASEKSSQQLCLTFANIPVKTVSLHVMPRQKLIPCGLTVGVKIQTEGVMVLGTGFVNGEDGKTYEPCKNILKSGDIILKAGDRVLENKEELIDEIYHSTNEVLRLEVERDGEYMHVEIEPIRCVEDNQLKIGVWVRDSTQGIGTITYVDPETGRFGALGHGILDVDTKELMQIKEGKIMNSYISDVKKGKKGLPGELVGEIYAENLLGDINKNTYLGIYGHIHPDELQSMPLHAPIEVALKNEIETGEASIYSNVTGQEIKEYRIWIEKVNLYSHDSSKGIVIRITDEELLQKTNGIVQGMSGSPIVQNNKLVGAVTHVFVQDPTKGYGIFIENMLSEEMGNSKQELNVIDSDEEKFIYHEIDEAAA